MAFFNTYTVKRKSIIDIYIVNMNETHPKNRKITIVG